MNKINLLIDLEFAREELFILLRKKIYSLLAPLSPFINDKECSHLLLRYFFNRNISRDPLTDDSLFILSKDKNNIANKQLFNDLKYFKIFTNIDKYVSQIETWWNEFSLIFHDIKKSTHINSDIKFLSKKSYSNLDLSYNGFNINIDLTRSKKFTIQIANHNINCFDYYIYYILFKRYKYIDLSTHGLARDFYNMGYYPSDDVTEGFAAHYNHFFQNWCSAFEEEKILGSLGSFFELNEYPTKTIYVNPPFDQTLLEQSVKHVLEILNNTKKHYIFIFTFPYWKDLSIFPSIFSCKFFSKKTIFKKGTLNFIDYMKNKIVCPCDIIEFIMKN